MLREWASSRTSQNSDERTAQIDPWLHDYNFHRPHSSLTLKTPASRAGLNRNNLLSLHALARAALIVVTHEFPDHVGGLLAQPDLKKLLAVTQLTREQVAELKPNLGVDSFAPLHLSSNIFDGYRPLDYVRYFALAPGVVLIKSPGHTPASQRIYVRRADGVEFLFLGDVAWVMRNVETQREKARLVDWIAGEDRTKVREELAGLSQLHVAYPEIHMMPGHDATAIDSFVQNGLLVKGFRCVRDAVN